MFTQNVGTVDRVIRVVLGLALIAMFFFYREVAYSWLFLLGIIPLVTGLIGTCPFYSAFGLKTTQPD